MSIEKYQSPKELVAASNVGLIKNKEKELGSNNHGTSFELEGQSAAEQEVIARISDESDRNRFNELLRGIPETLHAKYIKTLVGSLSNKDEVAVTTCVRGLLFELSRIQTLASQGLEKVDFNLNFSKEIEYFGYAKNTRDFTSEPNQKYESAIDFDVPVVRDGMPHVYEVKNYPRMQYGSHASQRNQLLKYQASIDQGIVEGATVEIKGRLNQSFLQWASGTNISEAGKIPDIEIIYNLNLPSGEEYRFVLKRSRKNNGLNFQNEGRLTTPEATLKKIKEDKPAQFEDMMSLFGGETEILNKLSEDRKIINGLQRSVLDRSVIDILSTTDIKNPPPELLEHLNAPMTIQSMALFDRYEALRKESIYEKLLAKREIINTDNKRSSCSEFASREYVEKSLREYQSYLNQNPEMAKVKKAYVLRDEEAIQVVIEKVMLSIENIKYFELQRLKSEEDSRNHTREERAGLGYYGQPEGVALDIEHLIIDAIQEVNKKSGQRGRSYNNPERFKDVEMLKQYLPDQDRRYLEIAIYDPKSGKTERNIDVNEAHIKRTALDLLKENLRRAEDRMGEIINRHAELEKNISKTAEESSEMKFLSSRLRAEEMQNRTIENLKRQIEGLKSEKLESVKIETDNIKKRAVASEFDNRIVQNMNQLATLYSEVLGGEKEWDKIAKRISEQIEQNLIKFIYTVKADGEIVVGEEIIRGDVSGRAAHSELAQGRNVYGAGELAFTKNIDGQWTLSEINNGSGHYRPSALTLPYVKNLLKLKGVNVSAVELRDALLRGTPLTDLTLLEE